MHYSPEDGHGLPHNPFKAVVAPRPIGWISSVDGAGRANLAPYSFFNAVADAPPMVMFAICGRKEGATGPVKDSLTNIRETGEFVANICGWDLREAMNESSAGVGEGVDEFDLAGLEKGACVKVRAPRVAAAPAAFECVLHQELILPAEGGPEMMNVVVFGRVVHVHLRDDLIVNGRFDTAGAKLLARCGYKDYAVVTETFEMSRPMGGDRWAASSSASSSAA